MSLMRYILPTWTLILQKEVPCALVHVYLIPLIQIKGQRGLPWPDLFFFNVWNQKKIAYSSPVMPLRINNFLENSSDFEPRR
jgi:hypothetical protein